MKQETQPATVGIPSLKGGEEVNGLQVWYRAAEMRPISGKAAAAA